VSTVAVSLAAGAASLASVFPALAQHLLLVSLIGLAVLTVVNMFGITGGGGGGRRRRGGAAPT